ncbi:MAG: VOC family protein [Acidimicrobiia bacterium]|nr:VOC family protein [Acidimicrobiia bacterium]
MLCKKLNHAAFRCRDARETAEFYTEVLGLKFSHAVGGDHVPSTGEYSPHIHLFFEMEDGSSLAFFEVPNGPGGMKDTEMDEWIQHFAFEVEDVDTLEKAKIDLESRGMDVVGITDHGFIKSIYFFDPSGHRLELSARTADAATLAGYAADAPKLLEHWTRHRNWSGDLTGLHVHE